MLNDSEKTYFQALLALKRKDYRSADRFFEKARPFYKDNKEFQLLAETNRLLLAVKRRLNRPEPEMSLEIEEMYTDG